MQRYRNLNECIQMCDRILRTNVDSSAEILKAEGLHQQSEKFASDVVPFKSMGTFYPSRTLVVQNFLPEAEVHVRSFVAMFGIVEICDVFRNNVPSCLAVVQYQSRHSAAEALLAMPHFQVRGSHLEVNLLWNGQYEHITGITGAVQRSFQECAEKRIVCIGNLPRTITEDTIKDRCDIFGRVVSVKVQPQRQGAFAYVVFQSPLSAAVATYCLRNSSTSNAALLLGFGQNNSPVLLGPVRSRPIDQYVAPLSAFDVRCICTRFLEYSRLKKLFLSLPRKSHQFIRPGTPEHCIRIPATQVKGVSLFVELLLLEGDASRLNEEVNDMAYQLCSYKYLFRFSIDFGLHKPMTQTPGDQRRPPNNIHYLRWNSFLILDLQVMVPWGFFGEPKLEPRLQTMGHICREVDPGAFEEAWLAVPLRHSIVNQSGGEHACKIRYILGEDLPFVRLVGSIEDLNGYKLPVHVYSETPASLKS